MPDPVPAPGLGIQTLLWGRVNPDFPASFAETPDGLLLIANGIDPMLRWDGLAQAIVPAGIAAPSVGMELGGTGVGYITGQLVAYVRFLDATGRVSDLSPVSNLMDAGQDGFIHDINYDATTGLVTVRSRGHALTGTQALVIDGVNGLPLVNGKWNVTVVDDDTFTVGGLVITGGIYTDGGVWTMGIQNIVYGAVPVPTDPKVVRRQILRSLAGTADVLYVDIDTLDITSTAFASQATDSTLAAGIPVPLTYGEDDLPFASRNGVPPSHKMVIASHKGRIYVTADASYSEGHAEPVFNATQVQGVGTAWQATFSGRMIYFGSASNPYSIASVDVSTQVITLASPYLDPPVSYTLYTIRPEPGERRLLYYSEAGLSESWPAYNALAIPETNDDIVGLLSLGQYLYILERRHIHRLTFQDDPGDGYTFLSATRGSINNRTFVVADGVTYCLDEIGIHQFDGAQSQSISLPVQNLFQVDGAADLEIDWTADQTLWHAAHDPVRDTIRWFVSFVGVTGLPNAICYNYRTDRWWLEQYPTSITASTNVTFGSRRSLVGTEARRILCLSEGNYDGVAGTGTLRGAVTSATSTTLTDSTASFDAVEGAPVSIVSGRGRDQTTTIASVTATQLEVVDPWTTIPDSTSVYQIGGIPWRWRSGWFRYVDSEESTSRDVEIVFTPTSVPTNLDFLLYFDQDASPNNWSRTITQDGVTTAEGDPHITVQLQTSRGWARQRLGHHAGTYSQAHAWVSVEMIGVAAGDAVRVAQVVLNDVEVE